MRTGGSETWRGRRPARAPLPAIPFVLLAAAAGARPPGANGEEPKAPVPSSPFLGIVYRYAEAMLEKGRDGHGPQKTGLFLSALDREMLVPLAARPPAPAGVRDGDRAGAPGGPLTGASPQHDENLLRVLYTLSELSAKPAYRDAADAELRWCLDGTRPQTAGILPGGEHAAWDALKDEPLAAGGAGGGAGESFRPWLLWDRAFDLAPEASARFARGLLDRQLDSPRQAGFQLRAWDVAHARTKDERFLEAIAAVLDRLEARRHPGTGLMPELAGGEEARPASGLSLAIDAGGAAHRVPAALASRLRAFAAREDDAFCALGHDLRRTRGFIAQARAATGEPAGDRTPLWEARHGVSTTAQVGLLCASRYENTGKVAYRELLHAAADAYLDSLPAPDADAWPGTFGHAISLLLAAWRSTARQVYLDRARDLGARAVEAFFGSSPLPRASAKSAHYESITGADTLALALVELHLHILYITAVRCPPNTADR